MHVSFVLSQGIINSLNQGIINVGKKYLGQFLIQWQCTSENGKSRNDKINEYCANATEFWTTGACLRAKDKIHSSIKFQVLMVIARDICAGKMPEGSSKNLK